jgi:hypothetical protein
MDSGAGISCASGNWVKEMEIPRVKGKKISIAGVTNGKLVTDEYILIKVRPPLRPDITFDLKLAVIPGIGMWTSVFPKSPRGLRKYSMYLADPDVISNKRILNFPVLLGGKYMSRLKMTAIYFNDSFALLDSVAGIIPRGSWPTRYHTENLTGFHSSLSYKVLMGTQEDEEQEIKVQPTEERTERWTLLQQPLLWKI